MCSDKKDKLYKKFEEILISPAPSGKKKEPYLQEFLEENSELIPTPNLLNHGLHLNCIVSKFPISKDLIPDYFYLTKSSSSWIVNFVELEVPDKKFFKKGTGQLNTTADFNQAISQISSWERYLEKNKQAFVSSLSPLLKPVIMASNKIVFNYQLVYGRSKEKNLTIDKQEMIEHLFSKHEIHIISWDTFGGYYLNGEKRKKNILSPSKSAVKLKFINDSRTNLFVFLNSSEIKLSKEQKNLFLKDGYDMESWSNGELLVVNWKYTVKNGFKTIDEQIKRTYPKNTQKPT